MSFSDEALYDLESYVFQTLLSRSLRIATASLLVYDTFISLDKEIKYFWTKPRSLVSSLYFANRYIGLFGALAKIYLDTLDASAISAWSYNLANTIVTIIVDYILVLRVCALWGRSKTLSILLRLLIVIEAAISIICFSLAEYLSSISAFALTPSINICIVSADEGAESKIRVIALLDWLAVITVGLILMILAAYRATVYWKSATLLKGLTLVRVLITDQLIWYFSIIACGVINIMVFNIRSSNGINTIILDALGNPSFLSLIGCHMLFNLKIAGEQGVTDGTDYDASTMSAVRFN